MTRNIAVFGEDIAHQNVITALLKRLSDQSQVSIGVKVLSSRGGIMRVHFEFERLLQDLQKGRLSSPDLVVVATDSNCKGYLERRRELERVSERFEVLQNSIAYAIPDPHIERWLLADPGAFAKTFGRGCNPLPNVKCRKDDYKQLLIKEVESASGVRPPLGGVEYSEEIVQNLNLAHVEKQEPSFEKLLKDLKGRFNSWKE